MAKKHVVKYPEHVRLAAVNDKSQVIGEFLDWMSDQGIVRAERFKGSKEGESYEGEFDDVLLPSNRNVIELLAEFFEIDRDALETEKRQMLTKMREIHEQSHDQDTGDIS